MLGLGAGQGESPGAIEGRVGRVSEREVVTITMVIPGTVSIALFT